MEFPFYVGLDVHKKSWSVSVFRGGERVSQHRQKPQVDLLFRFFERHGITAENAKVAYEAGPTGYWLYDALTGRGYSVLVVSPAHVPVAAGEKVKTDFRDSQDLAFKLSCGVLRGISVPTPEEREIRDLVRTRRQLVHQRASLIRILKAKLLLLDVPYGERRWGRGLREYVLGLGLPRGHQRAVSHLVDVLDQLDRTVRGVESDLGELFSTSAYASQVELLQTIPGIGRRGAQIIMGEMRDVSRFPTPDQFASALGLTPAEYSSGESIRRGRITRQGNAAVRVILIEAAWIAVKKDSELREFYLRLIRRTGSKRAIVAVARKLARIVHCMLTEGQPYRAGGRRAA